MSNVKVDTARLAQIKASQAQIKHGKAVAAMHAVAAAKR
jgi:hypothetical protein